MKPELEAARALLFTSDPKAGWTLELLSAADILMRACDDTEKVGLEDLIRCLDFPGVIAECGARGLYVRTGRDKVGWKPATSEGLPFSTSKADWLIYLRTNHLLKNEK